MGKIVTVCPVWPPSNKPQAFQPSKKVGVAPSTTMVAFNPYADTASMRGGLGITTSEIQRTLGEVPNDFDMSCLYQYTPVRSGWIAATDGFYNPPFGDASTAVATNGTAGQIDAMNNLQRRSLWLQALQTAAFVTFAGISVWALLRGRK